MSARRRLLAGMLFSSIAIMFPVGVRAQVAPSAAPPAATAPGHPALDATDHGQKPADGGER
ncbi:MAG: hypothetical protein AB7I33_08100 [Gemmatimonadales bacterium]